MLSIIDMVDKDSNDYYVPFSVIKVFKHYIGKPDLDEAYIEKLGFKIKSAGVCLRM